MGAQLPDLFCVVASSGGVAASSGRGLGQLLAYD